MTMFYKSLYENAIKVCDALKAEVKMLRGQSFSIEDVDNAMFEHCLVEVAEQEHIGIVTQSAYLGDLEEAIIAMAEDGWLYFGSEGMSEAQKKCYDAYMLIKPISNYKAPIVDGKVNDDY